MAGKKCILKNYPVTHMLPGSLLSAFLRPAHPQKRLLLSLQGTVGCLASFLRTKKASTHKVRLKICRKRHLAPEFALNTWFCFVNNRYVNKERWRSWALLCVVFSLRRKEAECSSVQGLWGSQPRFLCKRFSHKTTTESDDDGNPGWLCWEKQQQPWRA